MNNRSLMKRIAGRALAACALAAAGGCALGPDYRRPALEMPATYRDEAALPGETVAADWWTLYNDAALNELVAQVLANNSDARIAAAQVDEAEAVLRQVNASFFPQLDLGGGASRSRVSADTDVPLNANAPLIRNDRRLTVSTAFELDFWGFYSGFSTVGEKIEWRVKGSVPVALISRFNVADAEDSTKNTSYLIVSKISKTMSCVTDIVEPGAGQNETARALADVALRKPCKSI